MAMTESQVRALAAQIGAANEQRTRAIVQEELRAKTGVIPGGPYGSFSVDAQGRIVSAGAAAGGSILVAIAAVNPTQTITAGSTAVVQFDDIWDDPLTTISTGASWHWTPPEEGWYAFTLIADIDANGTPLSGENLEFTLYRTTAGADAHFFGRHEFHFNHTFPPRKLPLFTRQVDYCLPANSWQVKLSNGTARSVKLRETIYDNRIIIEKVRSGA